MRIQSQRAREIDAYLKSHPEAEVGKWPIEIAGVKEILPFFRFPIELLTYNANNGRLAMDIREWEQTNGRKLDGRRPEDGVIIRDMLQGLDQDKTSVLSKDLHQKGQMEPGVVTHDGVVINGNRRMAVLELLHQEEPTGKWRFLEAVRLSPTISERDLWRVEAGLQLSKDKVAEYHPVNELLKIKEGIDRGLSPEEVAAAMYAWKADEIEEALERLRLIDDFLVFFGQKGNYGIIKRFGLHEYFIDIQKRVIAPAVRNGEPAREQQKRVKYAFALIRASILPHDRQRRKSITHWDIRKLDRVYTDAHARATFVEPLAEVKELHKVPPEAVINGFNDAIDILRMREERDQPVRLIEKAINALQNIDRQSQHFYDERVRQAMERLSALVQIIEQQLAEPTAKRQD
jgi:hypothetical protein